MNNVLNIIKKNKTPLLIIAAILLAFILFGQDEMAYVFLRIVKVNILLILFSLL